MRMTSAKNLRKNTPPQGVARRDPEEMQTKYPAANTDVQFTHKNKSGSQRVDTGNSL